MRIFLSTLILIFIFQSWTNADDISDFEIEGMSIGDTLLSHMNKQEITNSVNDFFNNKKYTSVRSNVKSKYFDYLDVAFLSEDKNYIIKGISGVTLYENNHDQCMNDRFSFVNEINDFFKKELESKKAEIVEGKRNHTAYLDGKSMVYFFAIRFIKTKNFIVISCIDIDTKDEINDTDHFRADVYTSEYDYFLTHEAYK